MTANYGTPQGDARIIDFRRPFKARTLELVAKADPAPKPTLDVILGRINAAHSELGLAVSCVVEGGGDADRLRALNVVGRMLGDLETLAGLLGETDGAA